jgi:hypothetical protein
MNGFLISISWECVHSHGYKDLAKGMIEIFFGSWKEVRKRSADCEDIKSGLGTCV